MKYKAVLFDLDGTLMDTSPGIIHCYNTTALNYGKEERPSDCFRNIIGGTLPDNFKKHYSFTDDNVREAVEFYRKEYEVNGIHMAEVYKGIPELLSCLKENGIFTAIATLKREDFAVNMMKEFGLYEKFDVIKGMDKADTKTKSSIIDECLGIFNISPSEAVLIGDSKSDASGAEKSGVDFIGVTYGWGFATGDDVKKGYYTSYSKTVEDLKNKLFD